MADYNSKIALSDGRVLIDLTADTVTADKLAQGITAHDMTGAPITGTSTKDSDTSDATIAVAEMLDGKTAYARGAKLTGTMPNNGAVSGTISSVDDSYTVGVGFHDGSGTVQIADSEKAKIIEGNIKAGVTILGTTGTYSGESISAQSKTVDPTFENQTIQPDAGYDYLSTVTVNGIRVTRTLNSAGGYTVTIG